MREPQNRSQHGRRRDPLDPGGAAYARVFSDARGISELDVQNYCPRVCSIDNPTIGEITLAAAIFGVEIPPLTVWEIQNFCKGNHELSIASVQELTECPVTLSYGTSRGLVQGNTAPSVRFDLEQRDWYRQPLAQMEIRGVPHRGELRPALDLRFSREYADGWEIVGRAFRAFSRGLVKQNLLAHEPDFIRGDYAPIWFSTDDSKISVRAERKTQIAAPGAFLHLHPLIFPLAVAGRSVPLIEDRIELVARELKNQFGFPAMRVPGELQSNDPTTMLARVMHTRQEQPWMFAGYSHAVTVINGSVFSFALNATPQDTMGLLKRVEKIERQMAYNAHDRSSFFVTQANITIENTHELYRLFDVTGARGLRSAAALKGFHDLLEEYLFGRTADPFRDLSVAAHSFFDSLCKRTKGVSVHAGVSLDEIGKAQRVVTVSVETPQARACILEFSAGQSLQCTLSPGVGQLMIGQSFMNDICRVFGGPSIPRTVRRLSRDSEDPTRGWVIPDKLSVRATPQILWKPVAGGGA